MKKILLVFSTCIICLFFVACMNNSKNTDNAVVILGNSEKFDQIEIQAAIDCVLKKFKSFKGCELQKIWYDEEISNAEYGKDNVNGIVLLSNFHVDASGGDGSLNPNSNYTDWKWLLIRESKTKKWVIKDWGYA